MKNKVAIITGISGQDSSYLSEFLLEKDYDVVGIKRRNSSNSGGNVQHLLDNPHFRLEEGDVTDLISMTNICKMVRADEMYHLAAQSHVGTSFSQPIYTFNCNAIGTFNCLEAIRVSGINTKLYNASTSELFGGLTESITVNGSSEKTPFHPRSPYGIAKLAGFWWTKHYREAYNMYAVSGILFNHECFFADTPVIIEKENRDIDIVYISSLVPHRKDISSDSNTYIKEYDSLNTNIWDGNQFVKLKAVSRRKLSMLQNATDQYRQITIAPGASIATTPNHKLVKTKIETKEAREMTNGTQLVLGRYPDCRISKFITEEFAELLGLLAGDGHISKGVRLTNNDPIIQQNFIALAKKTFFNITSSINSHVSGYNGTTTHVDLHGLTQSQCEVLREMLYETRTKHKKVPAIILNAKSEIQLAFLKGYNQADGLKQDKTNYEFKSFKTNSPLLAQGILYLVNNTIKSEYCINTFEQNGKVYHQINLRSPNKTRSKGDHLILDNNIVKKIINRSEDNQHVFDIETESGIVMAGIGIAIVGNSPRRGSNFVTRKITLGIKDIVAGKIQKIKLGNIDTARDWGFAGDFVKAMWLMLNHDYADDYVIGTGETHTIREFLELAFQIAGLGDYQNFIEIDPGLYRPAEVNYLKANWTRAREELGWRPSVHFRDLVRMMVEADLGVENV
jgi:GDPmannose 4,6-dehydratase